MAVDIDKVVAEAKKHQKCIYIAVPTDVADGVSGIIADLIAAIEQIKEECEHQCLWCMYMSENNRLKRRVKELEGEVEGKVKLINALSMSNDKFIEDILRLEGEVKAGAHLVATVGDKNRELEGLLGRAHSYVVIPAVNCVLGAEIDKTLSTKDGD